jgi:thiol:disulfide interchange protein
VPLYVYYEKGNNNFKILNQILTRDDFRELLGK